MVRKPTENLKKVRGQITFGFTGVFYFNKNIRRFLSIFFYIFKNLASMSLQICNRLTYSRTKYLLFDWFGHSLLFCNVNFAKKAISEEWL